MTPIDVFNIVLTFVFYLPIPFLLAFVVCKAQGYDNRKASKTAIIVAVVLAFILTLYFTTQPVTEPGNTPTYTE